MSQKNRKYKSYKTLAQRLRRDEIEFSGRVASFLLSEFLDNGGRLRAPNAVTAKICEEGKFNDWRNVMRQKEWLDFKLNPSKKWVDYYPGKKLAKYINTEKENEELATRKELDYLHGTTQEQFDSQAKELMALKNRMNKAEKAITAMIEEFDPPVTDNKIERRMNLVPSKTH